MDKRLVHIKVCSACCALRHRLRSTEYKKVMAKSVGIKTTSSNGCSTSRYLHLCVAHNVKIENMLLQSEIEKYRVENVTAEDVRHRNLSQLEQRLTETREEADWYRHKHDAAVKRVDQLKVSIRAVMLTVNFWLLWCTVVIRMHQKCNAAVKRV